ncbi:ABC transporter ATP-binding protein [Dichotomicrobium thermohalophilum]|uniref:Amino acid/amide ABC transporter ATP-binding protein 2 (HAAT family) n=1 Tax=Dichotomicrobium thermohalophilum TaxID=933063 RepID=A0A397PNN1_9HYPH|nr:ABC transporter ATP-binding protein [Dichotomicrobium thermohalophilum]RIA47644.1 amino acid/amide ABC transporter ATP-binding protein 2 (HAAT family) [Dichotomicrobium thermohalophilum]
MLKVEGLHCNYGKVSAVRDLNMEVAEGELVTLIGANGAGKTTTLKAISGLLPPTEGRIVFDGEDITNASPRRILELGIAHCPEGRRVFPYMSVRENLEMGCFLRSDPAIQDDMENIFARFPVLRERRDQAAGTLSGGEQQMLAISRALMSRPKLILFDEPSLGLAPNLVERTFEIVREIREKDGVTVVMVEQNAFAALELCDHSYVLESGETTLQGTGEELLRDEHVRKAYLGG